MIFWLSSLPEPPDVEPIFPRLIQAILWLVTMLPFSDKIGHALLYAGLAAVVSLGIRRSGRNPRRAVQVLVPIVFATFYGLTDEIHQLFVENRTFDLLDVAADAVGAAVAQAYLCHRFWKADAIREAEQAACNSGPPDGI